MTAVLEPALLAEPPSKWGGRPGRRRRRVLAGLAALLLPLAALSVLLRAPDASTPISDPLRWAAAPAVYTPTHLPTDRVLSGRVVNRTAYPLVLDTATMQVVDGVGTPLHATVRFLAGFVHPLYGQLQYDGVGDLSEQERLGLIARLAPGESRPVTVAWRIPAGGGPALRVVYPQGALTLP